MNSFYNLIASLIKEADEATSSHSSYRLVDPNAVGSNPVRELHLDVVPVNDGKSIVSLAWDGGNKVLEKTASSEECQHMAQLISSDLAQAVKLTSEDKYDEAKNVITNVLKTYAETTDTPVPTNLPPVTTTQASKDEFSGLWKQAKVSLRNIFPSGTIQDLNFDTQEELSSYQEKMQALSPQDRIPLWDSETQKGKSPEDETPQIAEPSLSYDQIEKEKAKSQQNLEKSISEKIKTEVESALEEKAASVFGPADVKLVEALRAPGIGRNWDEIEKIFTKTLNRDKDSTVVFLDDLRSKEEGTPVEEPMPEAPKPPENLVSPETHDKLLEDLDKPVDEKKSEPPVKEEKEPTFTPKDIMEIPEEKESSKKCPKCGEDVWDVSTVDQRLNKCWNCGTRFDNPEKESSIERADNAEIRRVASQNKQALNPLQVAPEIEEQPTAETSTQDTIPMGVDHPIPQPEDWVIVKSDLSGEKSSFRAKFVSPETHSDGSKWGIVDRDGVLLTVEMHRISKESEGAQTTEPVSAPELAQPAKPEIAVTPKQSDLYNESSLESIKAEVKKLEAQLKEIEKEAGSYVVMPMMYGIDDDSILAYANGSIYKNKIDSNQMTDKDWEALIKDTARWMTQVGRESVSQTFSQDAEWKFDPEQINKLKSMFAVLPKASSQEKQSNVMDTKCEDCGKPLGPEVFLSKHPVCGECTRKKHKKVTGTEKQAEDDEVSLIMAYESGELDEAGILKLFSMLVKNGHAWSLQGHYGRTAKALIDAGYINEQGTITKDVVDTTVEPEQKLLSSKYTFAITKKAADPVPAPEVQPTQLKDVKITPDYVQKEKAVPASPEQSEVIAKMQVIETNLSTLDRAKEEVKAKLTAELKKIDDVGERASLEAEYKNQIEKLSILINAVDSKLIKYNDMFYAFQQGEVKVVPKLTPKELLEKIYKRFSEAEKFVQDVTNGMLSLAKSVTTRTLTRWPEKRSELGKEASVSDELASMNQQMLEALNLLSEPLA